MLEEWKNVNYIKSNIVKIKWKEVDVCIKYFYLCYGYFPVALEESHEKQTILTVLKDTLDVIEQLIDLQQFGGSLDKFFFLIDLYAHLRPVSFCYFSVLVTCSLLVTFTCSLSVIYDLCLSPSHVLCFLSLYSFLFYSNTWCKFKEDPCYWLMLGPSWGTAYDIDYISFTYITKGFFEMWKNSHPLHFPKSEWQFCKLDLWMVW